MRNSASQCWFYQVAAQFTNKTDIKKKSIFRGKIIITAVYCILGAGLIPCGAAAYEGGLAELGETDENQQEQSSAHESSPVVDQSFTNPNDLGADINEGFRFVGQIYTAGITGKLHGIAVNVLGIGTFPLHVTIRKVTAGVPNKHVLVEATLASNGSSLDNVVTFSKAIQQVAGHQYVIILDYPTAPPPGGGQSQGIWQGATGDLYPGGGLVVSSDGQTWISFDSQGFYDLHFQTLVRTRRH